MIASSDFPRETRGALYATPGTRMRNFFSSDHEKSAEGKTTSMPVIP